MNKEELKEYKRLYYQNVTKRKKMGLEPIFNYSSYEDLTGKKFGKLTVREFAGRKNKDVLWLCDCECGGTKIAHASSLRAGKTTNCGCSRRSNLIGKRFGKLTVIEEAGRKYNNILYKCKCDCGEYTNVLAKDLNSGAATSCGCKNKERFANKENREKYGWKDGTRLDTFEKGTNWNTNTSGVRGVSWNKSNNGWIVRITYKGKVYHLGTFRYNEFEEAKALREEANQHVLSGDFEAWVDEFKNQK